MVPLFDEINVALLVLACCNTVLAMTRSVVVLSLAFKLSKLLARKIVYAESSTIIIAVVRPQRNYFD